MDPSDFVRRAAAWLAEGLRSGGAAVAIATRDDARAIRDGLAEHGVEQGERLVVADAEATLASVLAGSAPLETRFLSACEELLDRAAGPDGSRPVRVFGSMAGLLASRGEGARADTFERLANRLLERRRFSLLCGYRVPDPFARAVQVALLPQVAGTHRRVLGVGDEERMRRAVDAALVESLGDRDALRVVERSLAHGRGEHVPAPQLALMWVSAHMPRAAERVLTAAREHYLAPSGTLRVPDG